MASEENIMLIQLDLSGVNISIFKSHKPFFIRQVATGWLESHSADRQVEQAPSVFQDILVEVAIHTTVSDIKTFPIDINAEAPDFHSM